MPLPLQRMKMAAEATGATDVACHCAAHVTRVLFGAVLCAVADGLLVWGWRVPFLLALLSLVAATILRYNMPGECRTACSKVS